MGWEEWSNKPFQLEFHNSGLKERASISGNGVGKSIACSWETAAHALGEYPDWYQGFRFDRPVKVWVGAIDADQQREGVQNHLLGPDLSKGIGTGFIPKHKILGKVRTKQAGIAEVADRVLVQHSSGGVSVISFKTYAQGWRTWQAAAPDVIQLDEEPDENDNKQKGIFSEAQTRIFRSGGILYAGLTPLLGETELTRHFMSPQHEQIGYVSATWDDAPHLKQEDKDRLIRTYPTHMIDVRTRGVPMMGEGRIIDVDEKDFLVDPFPIPKHFARIAGIDFGIGAGHPTAGAWLAWDRDRDIVFLYDEYRKEGMDSVYHAEAFKRKGQWIPVSWPHDGHKTSDLTRENSRGSTIADKYREHGVNMLGISARYNRKVGGETGSVAYY